MVAEALQSAWDRGSPVILVGHSFGSVIAWDTLWELSRLEGNPGNVDLFLTMGSPLTMQYIRGQLKGARQSRAERYPENISRWINVAAVGEVTALGRKMSNLFGDMVTLGLTESISDNLETVNQFHGPFGLNPHKCYGYMASQEVAQILLAEFSRGAST